MKFNISLLTIFVVMLVLKLANLVTWSWYVICIPLYPLVVFALVYLVALAVAGFIFGKVFSEVIKTLWR